MAPYRQRIDNARSIKTSHQKKIGRDIDIDRKGCQIIQLYLRQQTERHHK
jgi:hypothetical protein